MQNLESETSGAWVQEGHWQCDLCGVVTSRPHIHETEAKWAEQKAAIDAYYAARVGLAFGEG